MKNKNNQWWKIDDDSFAWLFLPYLVALIAVGYCCFCFFKVETMWLELSNPSVSIKEKFIDQIIPLGLGTVFVFFVAIFVMYPLYLFQKLLRLLLQLILPQHNFLPHDFLGPVGFALFFIGIDKRYGFFEFELWFLIVGIIIMIWTWGKLTEKKVMQTCLFERNDCVYQKTHGKHLLPSHPDQNKTNGSD